MKTSYYDGDIFYDMDDQWKTEQCQYPKCTESAIGRANYGDKSKFPPMGYMLVCEKHLLTFARKYLGFIETEKLALQIYNERSVHEKE